MFRQSTFVVATLCALFIAGCDSAPTHDSIAKESVTTIEDGAAILATVKDEASMNEARPKLKEINERMHSLKQKQEKLGEPDKAKRDELKKQYEDRMSKAFGSMLQETMRIKADPKLAPILQEMKPVEK